MSHPRRLAPSVGTELPAPSRRQAAVVAMTWVVTVLAFVVGLLTARPGSTANDVVGAVGQGIPALLLVSVGAFLIRRLPGNVIGWLLAAGGFVIAVSGAASGLADFGLVAHPGAMPGAIWFAWLGQWIWAPEIAALFVLLPAFFPTGRLPSARWRPVVPIAGALVLVGSLTSALGPWVPNPYSVGNPIALTGEVGTLNGWLNGVVATGLVFLGGTLAITSLVQRYRTAGAVERQQLRWFVAVAALTALAGAINITAYTLRGSSSSTSLNVIIALSGAGIDVSVGALPIAIGLAVLRYRLYEIDRLISRTISWAIVTALIAALFAVFILAMQAVLSPLTASNVLAVAGSTLLVAALFTPIRRRVQRVVDRRFNRSRYDAERSVAAFAERLRDEVDVEALRAEILATVTRAVEPASVGLWQRP